MNDPHVETLFYRVEHSPFVIYETVQSCERELPECRIKIERDQAIVEPKGHFSTAEEARAVVEPFLRAWELSAALDLDDPEVLRFVHQRTQIIDRAPGTLPGSYGEAHGHATAHAVIAKVLDRYPAPPTGFAVNSEVKAMFDRWSRYVKHRDRLGDAANLCLTILEDSTHATKKRRDAAATKYTIAPEVLSQLGRLAGTKGGSLHGRKGVAVDKDYTDSEVAWLEAALKKLIRRAAEVAHGPLATRPLITMRDLPELKRA